MDIDAYRFCVIGPGRLGSTLVAGLLQAGLTVPAVGVRDDVTSSSAVPRRVSVAEAPLQADLWWLTVPDDEIRGIASRLASAVPAECDGRRPVAIHSSGLGSIDLLAPLAERGVRILCLHPLQTFTQEPDAGLLQDTPCAVTAADPADVDLGEALSQRLGMRPFRLPDEKKPLYHLAAVMGCNLLVALESAAGRLMDAAAGDDRGLERMAPLLRTTLANLLADGDPAHVLTGPVARGDAGTVRAHLRRLDAEPPRVGQVYRALSLESLALVAPRLDNEQVRALRGLLEKHDNATKSHA